MKFMCINLYNASVKEGSEESIEVTIIFLIWKLNLFSFFEGMYYVWVRGQSAELISLLPC